MTDAKHTPGPLEQRAIALGADIDSFIDGDHGYVTDDDECWGFPSREDAARAAIAKATGGA